jgi:hypothetical protein
MQHDPSKIYAGRLLLLLTTTTTFQVHCCDTSPPQQEQEQQHKNSTAQQQHVASTSMSSSSASSIPSSSSSSSVPIVPTTTLQQQRRLVPRIEPVAIPLPTTTTRTEIDNNKSYHFHDYMGNIQLLEERFLQLCSSLRALYRSIQELDSALQQQDNNDDDDNDDDGDDKTYDSDLVDAILENQIVFYKQKYELEHKVIPGMVRILGGGTSSSSSSLRNPPTDVPDDIVLMDVNTICDPYKQNRHPCNNYSSTSTSTSGVAIVDDDHHHPTVTNHESDTDERSRTNLDDPPLVDIGSNEQGSSMDEQNHGFYL